MTEGTEFAGLSDRIITIINSYILAQENGRALHVYHDKGFQLEKYLEPNKVDWRIHPSEISWGLNRVSFLWFDQFSHILKDERKEYHAYALYPDPSTHFIPELRSKYPVSRVFKTLFIPSKHLQSLVQDAMLQAGIEENNFLVFHLRFLNFFEPVEANITEKDITGTPEQQNQMLKDVHLTIDKIYRQSGCRHVLLMSDSNRFLQAPHPEYIKTLPGSVGHIGCHNDDLITDKAFTDFFVISKARQVYSIIGPNIYGGRFARTAAAISGKMLIEVPYIHAQA